MIGAAILAMVVVGLANVLTWLANEKTWLHRVLHLPNMYLCSNRRLVSPRRPAEFWAFDTLSPDDPTSSYFAPTFVLLLYRVFIVVYFGATLLVQGLEAGDKFGRPGYVWISFFTDWTFCLFGFTGVIGIVVTVQRMLHDRRAGRQLQPEVPPAAGQSVGTAPTAQLVKMPATANGGAGAAASPLVQRWTALKVIHLLSVETAAASTLFLTVFYWVALAGSSVAPDNYLKHGANNVVILGDVLLSRVPFASYHYQISLLYGTVYIIFMCAIWWPVKGYWVYSVFDWSKWKAVGAYAVLPVLLFIAFMIWTGIARLREAVGRWWLHTRCCSSFWRPSIEAAAAPSGGVTGLSNGQPAIVPMDLEMQSRTQAAL